MILILSSSYILREMLKKILEGEIVEETDSVKKARELIQANKVKVLLVDFPLLPELELEIENLPSFLVFCREEELEEAENFLRGRKGKILLKPPSSTEVREKVEEVLSLGVKKRNETLEVSREDFEELLRTGKIILSFLRKGEEERIPEFLEKLVKLLEKMKEGFWENVVLFRIGEGIYSFPSSLVKEGRKGKERDFTFDLRILWRGEVEGQGKCLRLKESGLVLKVDEILGERRMKFKRGGKILQKLPFLLGVATQEGMIPLLDPRILTLKLKESQGERTS